MAKGNILLVEDDLISAKIITSILRKIDYYVYDVVKSGEEAIKRASDLKPDLILMDIILEGPMDGIDAAEKIHTFSSVPVIYVSAYAGIEILEKAKVTSPFGYIMKPVEEKDLSFNIEMALYKYKSEKRYRHLVEFANEGIWSIDSSGNTSFVNKKMSDMLGYTQEEMAGKHLFSFMEEKNIVNCRNYLEKRQSGVYEKHDFEFLRKDGRKIYTIVSATPYMDEKGNYTGATAFITDITERREMEEALMESREKYYSIFESESDTIVLVDRETGQIMDINNSGTVMYGYKREEFLSMKTSDCSAEPEKTFEATRKAESFIPIRYHKKKDGTTFPVEIKVSPLLLGGKECLLATVRDITERVKYEKDLSYRLSMEELIANLSKRFINVIFEDIDREIKDALKDIAKFVRADRAYIILCSHDGLKVSHVYEWADEETYLYIDKFPGLSLEPFKWSMDKLRSAEILLVTDMENLPHEACNEKNLWKKQNIKSTLAIPLILNKSFIGFHGFSSIRTEKIWKEEDISLLKIIGDIFIHVLERKKAEKQVRESLAEKEVLLREIFHRVKNNLSTIISLINMQADSSGDETFRLMIKELQSRIRTMSLVHESLYQSGNLSHVDFRLYLNNLAKNIYNSFCFDRSVNLKLDISEVFLSVDTAIPCGLVVNELLTNAFKYAFQKDRFIEKENSGKEISLLFHSHNDEFILILSDNGAGLPEDFDLANTKSLGLRLVNILVKHQLNGNIYIDRSHGTEFKIIF